MQTIAMLSQVKPTITAAFREALGECPEHFLSSKIYPMYFAYTWGELLDKVCYLPYVDLNVNMILEKLESLGLSDTTVIINDSGYRA